MTKSIHPNQCPDIFLHRPRKVEMFRKKLLSLEGKGKGHTHLCLLFRKGAEGIVKGIKLIKKELIKRYFLGSLLLS
jgi:hypothetical protein